LKTKDIVALLKDGKKPLVRLTANLWDDSWGAKGMIARIVGFKGHQDDTVELMFDYNEHRENNLALQSHDYWLNGGADKGTAFEAGMMKEDDVTEEVYFSMYDQDEMEVPVVLADSPVLEEYVKSGSKLSYVEWLEKFVEDNVPEAMKPWSKL